MATFLVDTVLIGPPPDRKPIAFVFEHTGSKTIDDLYALLRRDNAVVGDRLRVRRHRSDPDVRVLGKRERLCLGLGAVGTIQMFEYEIVEDE